MAKKLKTSDFFNTAVSRDLAQAVEVIKAQEQTVQAVKAQAVKVQAYTPATDFQTVYATENPFHTTEEGEVRRLSPKKQGAQKTLEKYRHSVLKGYPRGETVEKYYRAAVILDEELDHDIELDHIRLLLRVIDKLRNELDVDTPGEPPPKKRKANDLWGHLTNDEE